MKNYLHLIFFISLSTLGFAQNETTVSTANTKIIEPFAKGDFTITGNVNYLKNNNGGISVFSSLPSDVESTFSAELRPQILLGENFAFGVILGYSSIEAQSYTYTYYNGIPLQLKLKNSIFYYGLSLRGYFPIFPRAYAFIGFDAYTGELKTIVDEKYNFVPSTPMKAPRMFQGAFNPGFSYFISPTVMLELKYGRLGATVVEDATNVFAELDFNSMALGVTLRF